MQFSHLRIVPGEQSFLVKSAYQLCYVENIGKQGIRLRLVLAVKIISREIGSDT